MPRPALAQSSWRAPCRECDQSGMSWPPPRSPGPDSPTALGTFFGALTGAFRGERPSKGRLGPWHMRCTVPLRWSTTPRAAAIGCARLSQEARMLTRKTWHRTALIALTAIAMSAGLAWATHVRIEGSVEQPSLPGLTVVAPPSLQADEIKAR